MGVLHGDEIDYVFGNPLNKSRRYTEDEAELSRRIISHYGNFARHGTPVYNSSESWPLYNRNEPQYYIWNANIRGTGEGPRATQCAFWNEFVPMLRKKNRTGSKSTLDLTSDILFQSRLNVRRVSQSPSPSSVEMNGQILK